MSRTGIPVTYHNASGETLRTIETPRFRVEILSEPEYTDPMDKVAWSPEEDRAYAKKIYNGELPWFVLVVKVYLKSSWPRMIGFASLGCIDTLDLHSVGLRDIVSEAVSDARYFLEEASR